MSFIIYLLFDLSTKDQIHLALFDENSVEHKNYPGRNRELLSCTHNLLEVYKVRKVHKVKSIGGIMVVTGIGGFTSTRVACVVANTFAYVLRIPLLTITSAEASDPQKLIPKLLKQKSGNYISATYSGEANIGRKKV